MYWGVDGPDLRLASRYLSKKYFQIYEWRGVMDKDLVYATEIT